MLLVLELVSAHSGCILFCFNARAHEIAMSHSDRLPSWAIRQAEASGVIVLVTIGALSGAVALALGIRCGPGGALMGITAGAIGILLAGLWQGLAHIPWVTNDPKCL
jgi:hypothetical protein